MLDILIAPHPALRVVAEPVAAIDAELRRLMGAMLETMYKAPGIGLAAPQVGVAKRVVVMDLGGEEAREPLLLVNPEITWRSEEVVVAEEGCLSLPEQFAEVRRHAKVRFRYLDEQGRPRDRDAEGLLGRCVQHEVDHLDGILFVDHLSALKRNMILRRLAKARRLRA